MNNIILLGLWLLSLGMIVLFIGLIQPRNLPRSAMDFEGTVHPDGSISGTGWSAKVPLSSPNNFNDYEVHQGQGFDLGPGESAVVTMDTAGNSTYQKQRPRN